MLSDRSLAVESGDSKRRLLLLDTGWSQEASEQGHLAQKPQVSSSEMKASLRNVDELAFL